VTSPSVIAKGVPSIASAIASDGNGLLDVGAGDARRRLVLRDHDEDRVCRGDRRQRNRPRQSGGAGDGKEATS
jgi:hypothetical protein